MLLPRDVLVLQVAELMPPRYARWCWLVLVAMRIELRTQRGIDKMSLKFISSSCNSPRLALNKGWITPYWDVLSGETQKNSSCFTGWQDLYPLVAMLNKIVQNKKVTKHLKNFRTLVVMFSKAPSVAGLPYWFHTWPWTIRFAIRPPHTETLTSYWGMRHHVNTEDLFQLKNHQRGEWSHPRPPSPLPQWTGQLAIELPSHPSPDDQ